MAQGQRSDVWDALRSGRTWADCTTFGGRLWGERGARD